MANPEHLKILKRGARVWNRWREEPLSIRLDFENAKLYAVNLPAANLTDCHFRGADMRSAVLTNADIRGANLTGVNFKGANLSNANLSRSDVKNGNLSNTNLSEANLQSAELFDANFTGAMLKGADFTDAKIGGTIFGGNNLSGAKGLEFVKHYAPSVIGIETIYRSQGQISETFLHDCGVTKDFITYIRSLVTPPIQFHSCFISYSSKDQDFASKLHEDLQNKGVRCWFAPKDLKIGDKFRDRIDESIRLHDKLLNVLSENSVASPWVGDEVESAIEREHREERTVLFPIKIDEAVMVSRQAWAATIRRARHIGDFTRWKGRDSYQKALDGLLRDLKAEEDKA